MIPKILNKESSEKRTYFELSEGLGEIFLCAKTEIDHDLSHNGEIILVINKDGVIDRAKGVSEKLGFQCDDLGRVLVR